jgi:hypothetical protein
MDHLYGYLGDLVLYKRAESVRTGENKQRILTGGV